jgi:hypothetical protein
MEHDVEDSTYASYPQNLWAIWWVKLKKPQNIGHFSLKKAFARIPSTLFRQPSIGRLGAIYGTRPHERYGSPERTFPSH